MNINSEEIVTVSMPCFNEAEGIAEFADELCASLGRTLYQLIIVDDCSTDETFSILQTIAERESKIVILRNPVNCGHGPSTLVGLNQALRTPASIIMTLDGDGQFITSEVKYALDFFCNSNADLLEGSRQGRTDPWFRKVVTRLLRLMIFLLSGKLPKDSNTPFRIYKKEIARSLMSGIDPMAITPNLLIGIRARRMNCNIEEFPVTSINRRGSIKSGVTWQSKSNYLPSGRFLRFCFKAIIALMRG